MNEHISCDKTREDVLEQLQYMEPGLDSIITLGNYYSRVDDRYTINNFSSIIKDATRKCEKMANTKLWIPVHAQVNCENLANQLGLNWPSKAEENFRHIRADLEEIEETFQRKGLKPTHVSGVPRYEPKNNEPSPAHAPRNTSQPAKSQSGQSRNQQGSKNISTADEEYDPIMDDERLKNIDKNIVKNILSEVVSKKQPINWDDIAGLDNVKEAINEIVVYPMQNPDLFKGLLAPAKGLLLFGPPGTGKTLIGKCIANESGATFFAISASSLTSKWVGEGEKMVRAMFAVARCMQPSVVFIDEIDSLLTARSDGEHDSTRRIKTEFLVQFDGVATGSDDRLLVVGATNRPQELDEAARRRFTKRIYIPLPNIEARMQMIKILMKQVENRLTDDCCRYVAEKTASYSGADMTTLCKEAALVPVRRLVYSKGSAKGVDNKDVQPVTRADFDQALRTVKASVSGNDLGMYEDWDHKYGANRESRSDSSQATF